MLNAFKKKNGSKKISEMLDGNSIDTVARNVIEKIKEVDKNLNHYQKNSSRANIISITKQDLIVSKQIYKESLGVDVDLVNKDIYLNKKLDIDTQTVFCIMAHHSFQKHIECWPKLPNHNSEESVYKYNSLVQNLKIELKDELTSLLQKIKDNTDLKINRDFFSINFVSTPNLYFGINEHKGPSRYYEKNPLCTMVHVSHLNF